MSPQHNNQLKMMTWKGDEGDNEKERGRRRKGGGGGLGKKQR